MSDIYKIGVAIMLTQNGVGPALSLISHQLLGVHRSVAQINSGLGGWRTGLIGVAGLLGGSMILGAYAKIAEHGKEILNQQDKLIGAGRSQAEVAKITADAYERITKAVPTAKASDVLRVANELTFVKGDFSKASAAATNALKLEAIIANATGKSAEGQGYNMWRALEEKLVTQDEAHSDVLLGKMAQATIASGGKITGSAWQTFARRAGVSWIKANDEAVSGPIPTIMNSLGPDTAGTAYMTMYQTLMGAGTLSKQQYEQFNRLGLIDPSKVTTDKGGRINVGPGGIKGALENEGNLAEWAKEFLLPALLNIPESERGAVLAKMGRNRNTTRMLETFTNPGGIAQMNKDAALIRMAETLTQRYEDYSHKNPIGVEAAYEAQKASMLGALGAPLMQAAIPVMKFLTDLFNRMGEFFSKHPTAIQVAGVGIGILGAGLVVLGGALAITSVIGLALGPAGWLVGGIVALGAAVAGLAFIKDWLSHRGDMGAGEAISPERAKDIWRGVRSKFNHDTGHETDFKTGAINLTGTVIMDGAKVGEIVTGHMVNAAGGAIQGSAYFDYARASAPSDSSWANP